MVLALAACGGTVSVSSTSASASAAPASKPAAASSAAAVTSAKPAASAASAKPAGSATASGTAGAAASAKPAASGAPAASGSAAALPAIPAPVAVALDAKTSAVLALDFNAAVCQPQPTCNAILPTVAALLKTARDAKVPVVYSTTPTASGGPSPVVSQVAPQQGEPTVASHADKFIGTELDTILKKDGATTLVITGTAANGAVMYTAFHANALGYTAAVPVDAISSPNPVQNNLAEWQMLNEPGYTNADNKPLAQNQVTLTRTDLITFK
jgi:nicotinamidase-related amidase